MIKMLQGIDEKKLQMLLRNFGISLSDEETAELKKKLMTVDAAKMSQQMAKAGSKEEARAKLMEYVKDNPSLAAKLEQLMKR